MGRRENGERYARAIEAIRERGEIPPGEAFQIATDSAWIRARDLDAEHERKRLRPWVLFLLAARSFPRGSRERCVSLSWSASYAHRDAYNAPPLQGGILLRRGDRIARLSDRVRCSFRGVSAASVAA